MTRLSVRLAAAAALTAASSASAIDLGFGLLKKKPTPPVAAQPAKPDPALRLKQLLAALQSDPDVDRRKAAAEELKAADPRGSADLLPALVGATQKDPSPAVRTAAVEALGAMKAPTAAAGAALETVEKTDPDAGVRAAARAALWRHQVNGSKPTGASPNPATGQTGEPPFARPPLPPKSPTAEPTFRPITQGPGKGGVFKETAEPPFAKPTPVPAPRPVELPAPAIVAPPLPVPTPTPVPVPVPKDLPTIPVPMPMSNPPANPGDLPPLSIPALPPTIVAPPPGSGGLPTIVPPGSGR